MVMFVINWVWGIPVSIEHHSDIEIEADVWEYFPRPWRLEIFEDGTCWGIVAANDKQVVTTDSGVYAPDAVTAQIICDAVNRWRGNTIKVKDLIGTDVRPPRQ
jgi:hypothetical protein